MYIQYNVLVFFQRLFSVFTMVAVVCTLRAQIVYHDINPDAVTVMSADLGSIDGFCPLDMNNDGMYEYTIRWDDWETDWFMHLTYNTVNEIALEGIQTNDFGGRFIKRLNANAVIDQSLQWGNSYPEPFIGESTVNTNFLGMGDKYIGLRFYIAGQAHYGWLLVNFDTVNGSRQLTVKAYAWQSEAGQSIRAGQTGTLGIPENTSAGSLLIANPVTDQLVFRQAPDTDGKQVFRILDLAGRTLMDGEASPVVDVSGLIAGHYMLVLSEAGETVYMQRFVKE